MYSFDLLEKKIDTRQRHVTHARVERVSEYTALSLTI